MHIDQAHLFHSLFNLVEKGLLSLARLHQDICICLVELESEGFQFSCHITLHKDWDLYLVKIICENLIEILFN